MALVSREVGFSDVSSSCTRRCCALPGQLGLLLHFCFRSAQACMTFAQPSLTQEHFNDENPRQTLPLPYETFTTKPTNQSRTWKSPSPAPASPPEESVAWEMELEVVFSTDEDLLGLKLDRRQR